ncbi:MAG: hypothetical protein OEY59_10130, partial [Deltaproteobacteria bacterium]|nr:hypothetical protein [Deltaproteobacteria bacterium]
KKISRVSKNQLILLRKKLGDQTIALNELSGYFKSEIQYNEVPESPEKKLFNQAFDFFKKKETQKALFDFALFRQQYPKSDLIDDALYFTGYIHFISERYEQASLRFFELMERYPDSNRIRETTWWLGVTQERSGDLGGALDLYKKLLLLKKTDSFRISAESRIEELESSLELKEKGRR